MKIIFYGLLLMFILISLIIVAADVLHYSLLIAGLYVSALVWVVWIFAGHGLFALFARIRALIFRGAAKEKGTVIDSPFPREQESSVLSLLGCSLSGNDGKVVDQSFPNDDESKTPTHHT